MKHSTDIFLCILLLLLLTLGGYVGLSLLRQKMQQHFSAIHGLVAGDEAIDESKLAANDNKASLILEHPDFLNWKLLSTAHMVFSQDNKAVTVSYNATIKALNHHIVKAKGFLFPLEQGLKQAHFLISPYPPSCAFCLPAGPSELIEVTAKTPMTFTYDAVILKGTFELVTDKEGLNQGMVYRMNDAVIVE